MGWFRAQCPVEDDDRAWVDGGIDWLTRSLGTSVSTRPVLLPSDQQLDVVDPGSVPEIQTLVHRLCWYMGVDPALVTVGEFAQTSEEEVEQRLPGGVSEKLSEGHFRTTTGGVFIAVEAFEASTPTQVVASIAHELSHLRLPGGSRLSEQDVGEGRDEEELVDLVTVCLGLGVFAANACFSSVKVAGYRSSGFRTSLIGFMTERMYGYALARYTLLRGEPEPAWAGELDLNPRTYLKQALRFLAQEVD